MAAKILWASQTGNCEEISRMIFEEAPFRQVTCERYCLQELGTGFNISNNDVLVIVCSSTGDGELPDNGLKFYKWIKQQEGQIFTGVKYALLGLGDKNYSTFQGGPNTLENYMKKLGATEFYERGIIDEQVGIEEPVDFWIDGLWEPLKKEVDYLKKRGTGTKVGDKVEEQQSIWGRILEYTVLTEENAVKNILELRITTEGIAYIPGTAIFMYPQNPDEKVNEILGKLGLNSTTIISEKSHISKSIAHRVNVPITLFDFFKRYVDFESPIKTRFATYLASVLTSQSEKDDLDSHIDTSKITMSDEFTMSCLVNKYSSWEITSIGELLEVHPILSPRNYSISSSPVSSPGSITIAFTVMGLCTRYLEHAAISGLQVEYVLPTEGGIFWEGLKQAEKPIFISTGTGLSPFRGIIEHLALTSPKPVWLIHGCRNSVKNTAQLNYDHIYQNDLYRGIQALNGKVTIANSRYGDGPKYINEIIQQHENEIREWGHIALMCGNFNAKELKQRLEAINPNFLVYTEEWE